MQVKALAVSTGFRAKPATAVSAGSLALHGKAAARILRVPKCIVMRMLTGYP